MNEGGSGLGLRALSSVFKTVLLGFTVLFLFQNCGGVGGSLTLENNPGNGGGYEGLQTGDPSQGAPPAVVRYVFAGSCVANEPESVITFDGQYHLTVDACQVVNPPMTLEDIAPNADGTLTYDGHTYEVR